jgi:hypothetical protein
MSDAVRYEEDEHMTVGVWPDTGAVYLQMLQLDRDWEGDDIWQPKEGESPIVLTDNAALALGARLISAVAEGKTVRLLDEHRQAGEAAAE